MAKEGGNLKKEFIIVDDGSSDNSIAVITSMYRKLPGKLIVIRRKNLGASFSTNQAVQLASSYWIRLLDGDDLVTYKSTENMLNLARSNGLEFSYGLIGDKSSNFYSAKKKYEIQNRESGLRKFIKNCPANSSAILVSKVRYCKAGGCNENFVSPDQVLFLRLFCSGGGVFFKKLVAITPTNPLSGRLSSQLKRSRYESILAIIRLCEENRKLEKKIKKIAFKRALSRSYNYHKSFTNRFFSKHFFKYLLAKFYFPNNFIFQMYDALTVFTGDSRVKPKIWLTGSDKYSISKKNI